MANDALNARLLEKLQVLKESSFEGTVEFMYVDSSRKITVGVGHNLTDDDRTAFFQKRKFKVARIKRAVERLNAAAQSRVKDIPFPAAARIGSQASEKEISADYDYLEKLPGLGGKSPAHDAQTRENLRLQTTVELDSVEIQAVFEADLKKFNDAAHDIFAEFDSYSVPCQAAIIDLLFNYGKAGFVKNKDRLIKAIKGEDGYKGKSAKERWISAAVLSATPTANSTRNSKVSGWFMEGSKETSAGREP